MTPPGPRRAAVRLAADALFDDPLYRWLEPGPGRRRRVLEALMRRALATCAVTTLSATAAATDAPTDATLAGLVAIHDPDAPSPGGGLSPGLLRLLLRPRRAWLGLRLLHTLHRLRPRAPHVHVELLAVAAHARGQGLARRLLEPVLANAAARGLVTHLETTHPDNLGLYRHFGFEEVARVGGRTPTAWVLQRPPSPLRPPTG